MKVGVSLLTIRLTSNVCLLLGMINFLVSTSSEINTDILIEDDKDELYVRHGITPINYLITLTVNQTVQKQDCNIYFSGTCEIEILVNLTTDYTSIILHAQKPYVNVLSASIFEVTGREHVMKILQYKKSLLEVYSNTALNGRFILKLHFDSCPSDIDVFKANYKKMNNMLLFATHLLPTRTRALFPCFDDPRVKATFNFIINHGEKHTSFTSGRRDYEYEKWTWEKENGKSVFKPTYNISSYNVAIVIVDLHLLTGGFGSWYSYNFGEAFVFTWKIFQLVQTYLDDYEISKPAYPLLYIVIPGFPYDTIKKAGLIFFREDAILYNKTIDPFVTKIKLARLTSRVILHDWLDNVVSPISWDYLWINEAIATLFGQHLVNQRSPDLYMLNLFVVQFHQESMRLDADSVIGSIIPTIKSGININSLLSFSHYVKAPVILNMLRRVLSDEIFFKGVKLYYNSSTEATLDNFCTAMQNAQGNNTYNYDVKSIMHTWSKETHCPVVSVTETLITSNMTVLTMKFYESDMDSVWLPITITTQTNLNFTLTNNKIRDRWLKRGEVYVFTDYFINRNENDWIIVNLQQVGYFRVNYDTENWRKIAKYLNSDNYINIPVLNRAQIMDDAFYFLMRGQIDLSIFLNLINYLSRETDYIAWYPVFKSFENISGYLPYKDSAYIKEKWQTILDTALHKISKIRDIFDFDNDNIDDCLRQELTKWACTFESPYCKYFAGNALTFATRQTDSPLWQDFMHCQGIKERYATWRNDIYNVYMRRNDSKMLKYLACTTSPDIVKTYIDLITNVDKSQNKQEFRDRMRTKGVKEYVYHFQNIVARHAKNTIVLEYILENFERVTPRQFGRMLALTDIINHVYSAQHLDKIQTYIKAQRLPKVRFLTEKMRLRFSEIARHKESFLNLKPKSTDKF